LTRSSPDPLRLGICLLPVMFVGFLLIIPDEAGGGWTHTWRAEVFPYVGLVLACGTLSIGPMLRNLVTMVAGAGAFVMIAVTLRVQMVDVPPVMREFNEADALIGPHCTIAPVLAQFKLDPANTARLFYHPLFHLANRFELTNDRPVLFSYVARLPIYSARFQPNVDPQRLLYRWEFSQRDTRVRQIDIAGFEAATGLSLDYVLLWDFASEEKVPPAGDIRTAVANAHYELVHRSAGGRLELYRRPGTGGCAKL
jgi:hypothetical protein